jgi:hypothetical protein
MTMFRETLSGWAAALVHTLTARAVAVMSLDSIFDIAVSMR